MQAVLNTVGFRQHEPPLKSEDQSMVPKNSPSVAIHSLSEGCRSRAREAAAKAEVATNSKDKIAWLLAADRLSRLAEDIEIRQIAVFCDDACQP